MKKLVTLLFVFLFVSCNTDDNDDIKNCTDVFVYGLAVTVKDASTNEIITEELTVTARDGDYEEQLMTMESFNFFVGAGERSGNYIIEISSNNYQTFVSNEIVVEIDSDGCHVITEEVEFSVIPN